jgi:hypothetical protein
MNEQRRAELERIRDVLYPATGLEDYDEEIIGRVLKDIKVLLAQDAQPKQDVPETNFGNMAEPKIGCVNHDCAQCKGDQRARQALDDANAYALELQARLAKYEGGATMMLNTAPQPIPVKTYHDGKPWPVAPKPWVGLTDEEIDAAWPSPKGTNSVRTLVHIIEAKLKEKNK